MFTHVQHLRRNQSGRFSRIFSDDDFRNARTPIGTRKFRSQSLRGQICREAYRLSRQRQRTENDSIVTRELDCSLKEIQETKKSDDVFLWENPLHQTSPNNAPKIRSHYARTPDEQAEIEYDAPSIVNEMSVTKSVTPIKIINQTNTGKSACNITITSLKNIPEASNAYIPNSIPNDIGASMTNSCEEVTEAIKTSNLLPPPNEFGGGNPFLMFLCLTLLTQHRDHIISKAMDYNEMAMHFDKMVRRHNVIRVLNQARQMYARYIKQQSIAQQKIDARNEEC